MKNLNISLIALAATQVAGLGFTTQMLTHVATANPDEPSMVPMASQAILIVGFEDKTKYLKLLEIADDGKNATFMAIDHSVHSVQDLLKLDDHTVVGEAITLEDIMSGNLDDAQELLGFKVAQSAVA